MIRRWAAGLLALFVVGLLAGEVLVRAVGLTDYPLYRKDPQVGYIPRADQHGAFLRTNAWAFNDRSMGVAEPFRADPAGVLLLGDSIVLGGDPFNQVDKLGPMTQRLLGRPVWPIAAASWALENEMQEVLLNPDFLKLKTIVILSNSEDFGAPSRWHSEIYHPTHRPTSALVHVLMKYLTRSSEPVDAPWTPAAERVWTSSVRDFLRAYHGRIIWIMYPLRQEVGSQPKEFDDLIGIISGHAEVINLTTDSHWVKELYRDRLHPSRAGNVYIAQRIAETIAMGKAAGSRNR